MKRLAVALLSSALALALWACSSTNSSAPSTSGSNSAEDAKTVTVVDDSGAEVEIPANPHRIVSTSVALTGTLLAIDAPVVASGGSAPNMTGLDEHGWFEQWADIAEERNVESVFMNQELSLEAIQAQNPDVIIVSATGGDSHMDHYDQLKEIAPVLVIDYNSSDWRDVTKRVAELLNAKEKATEVLNDFSGKLKEAKDHIKVPADPVDVAVYADHGGGSLSVGLPTAPQSLILADLGFTVADEGVTPEKGRTDFSFTTVEQALQALKQKTLLLVGTSKEEKDKLLANKTFESLPAVQSGQVYELGSPSFKLDYYAALDLVKHVREAFAQ